MSSVSFWAHTTHLFVLKLTSFLGRFCYLLACRLLAGPTEAFVLAGARRREWSELYSAEGLIEVTCTGNCIVGAGTTTTAGPTFQISRDMWLTHLQCTPLLVRVPV
jgi:hypothetical protein